MNVRQETFAAKLGLDLNEQQQSDKAAVEIISRDWRKPDR